ncbi:MAG: GlsB/YeaQ/YmgE family stress response membrane protein [Chloroflexi bacterium]|nr:GlsB/YeaQ/YmgE family stress response membrane protein [Chloroflexota bacterium]
MEILALVVVLLLVLVVAGWVMSAAFTLIGFLLTLFLAGFIGWAADQLIPGELPYGWMGAVAVGLLGGLVGGLLLGNFGPQILGLRVIPTFVGAVILVVVAEYGGRMLGDGRSVRR